MPARSAERPTGRSVPKRIGSPICRQSTLRIACGRGSSTPRRRSTRLETVSSPRDEGDPSTRPIIPARRRRSVAVLVGAVALVALVGGMLYWRSTPDAGPGIAVASPSPSGAPASATPIPLGGPGAPVADGTWSPMATLTADDVEGGVVALDSGFQLASLDGTPAADLAAHLAVDPPVAFTVAADGGGTSARITPTEPLTAGVAYRFKLTADDGRTLDSWAFQTHQPLHVVATVPGDQATGVPDEHRDRGHVRPGRRRRRRRSHHHPAEGRRPLRAAWPDDRLRARQAPRHGHDLHGDGPPRRGRRRARTRPSSPTSASGSRRPRPPPRASYGRHSSSPTTCSNRRPPTGPSIAVWAFPESDDGDTAPTPKSARIEVHRLAGPRRRHRRLSPGPGAPALGAQTAVGARPDQGPRPGSPPSTRSSMTWTGTCGSSCRSGWPQAGTSSRVRSGTRPVQTILQVTDIAGYLVVSDTKTLVWANDLALGRAGRRSDGGERRGRPRAHRRRRDRDRRHAGRPQGRRRAIRAPTRARRS